LELNCIALLSNFQRPSIDPPSPKWLGLQSSKSTIQEFGLWNTNHVEKYHEPAFLERLRAYVGLIRQPGTRLYDARHGGHKGFQPP